MPATFYSYDSGTMGPIAGGVQAGVKFSAAHTSVSFSFPTAESQYPASPYGNFNEQEGFVEFLSGQKTAGRWAIQLLSEYIAKPFAAEVTESDSTHADIRGARTTTDINGRAHGYTPHNVAMGANSQGSDYWIRDNEADAAINNFTWLTILHETGHAMGLKHPHELGGGSPALPIMPTAQDFLDYTVMSYKSREGASIGYTNTHYPQNYMTADIEALQQMYGPNTTIRNGASTTVHFNPTTGEISVDGSPWLTPPANKIYALLPWSNADDYILDFSDYTADLTVDLRAGEGSILSTTQLASVAGGGAVATASIWVPISGLLPTKVAPSSGDDVFQGNSATNTLILGGNEADYDVEVFGENAYLLTDTRVGTPDGSNLITDFDFVEFADGTVAVGDLTAEGPGFTQIVFTVTA